MHRLNIHLYLSLSLSSSRGFVFGLWSACQSIGNILGAFLAALVVDHGYEVRPWVYFIKLILRRLSVLKYQS